MATSIIQVMDSNKSGKSVYIAASSVIVIAITLFLIPHVTAINIDTAIEVGVIISPIIGTLSLIFLIGKPDRLACEQAISYKLRRKDSWKFTKLNMAQALLFIRPWESSPRPAYNIDDSLENSIKRTLRSREFAEQMGEFKQAFWIGFLTPISFYILSRFLSIESVIVQGFIISTEFISSGIGLLIGIGLAYAIIKQNEQVPTRILDYAFARWFHEGASTDTNRRNAGFSMNPLERKNLVASVELSSAVVELAVQKDWFGFDRKSRNLEHLIGIPSPDVLKLGLITQYLIFVEWISREIYGARATILSDYLSNAHLQITDSIKVLHECRQSKFSKDEESVASFIEILIKFTSSRENLIQLNHEFYEALDKEMLKDLVDGPLEMLGKLIFNIKQKNLPHIGTNKSRLNRLSILLVFASEIGLMDRMKIFRIVSSWGIHPTTILEAIGVECTKTLLEEDVGFSLEDLISIAEPLSQSLRVTDNTNPELVFKRLVLLLKVYPRDQVWLYATKLQWDTIRPKSERPESAIEAITKFLIEK